MSKLHLKFSGFLLATSALIAPAAALAQDPPGAAAVETQPAEDGTTTVEGLVVRGAFIPDTMRETPEVATVLLQEDLARAGDDNVGEALQRTSGISLVGGRFVYVRGLGERYSSALLNGSPLPSPEPLQRVVPLDLFPANVLAGAVVQKTYSASFPGEFGGGVINIETLRAPARPFVSMGASVGLHSETTLRDGLTYYGSDTDWTGYDDETRNMPGLLARAIRSGRGRIDSSNFEDEDLDRIGSSLVNAPLRLLQRNNDIPGDFKAEISGGNTYVMGPVDLGVIGVAGFDNSWRTRRGVQEEGFVSTSGAISPDTHYDFESTQNDVIVNGLLGLALNWDENDVRWTNFYVHSTTKEARSRQGYDAAFGRDVRDDYTEWFERELISTQLAGNLELSDNFEIDWRGAFATTTREAPYENWVRYVLVGGEPLYGANNANRTSFSWVRDDVVSGGVDLTYRFNALGDRAFTVSAGYATSENDRYSSQRLFQFQSSSLPIEVQQQRVDFLFSDYNLYQDWFSFREVTGAGGAAAYDAGLDVDAVYLQTEAEVTPFLRVALGARVEDALQYVTPIDLFGGTPPAAPGPRREEYWLPAGTVTWNFAEDLQLRVGASKTIARPQFRELAPQQYLDPDSDRLFIGNPFLRDSELMNFDARLEWYFARNQFLAGGLFYKDIENPVEAIVNEGGSALQTTFINAPAAELYGAEIELRRYFEMPYGNDWMRNVLWFVSGNYTYTSAEVKVDPSDVVFPLSGSGMEAPASVYFIDGDQLQGQSDHLANLQFGFDDVDRGLEATLLLNYGSERISARGRPGFPDLVVDPGVTLDFTVRKDIIVGQAEYQVGLEARNLLDQDFEESQSQGGGVVFANAYDVGQSVSVSLKRRF